MFIGGFLIPFITINIFYILTNHSLKSRNKFFRYQVRTSIIKKGLVAEENLLLNESIKSKKKESSSNDLESIPDSTVVKLFRIKELMRLDSNKLSSSSNDAQFFNLLIKREKKLVRTIILNIALFCIAWVNTIYLFFNKFEHYISFFFVIKVPYAIVTLLSQFGSNIEFYITPYTTSIPAILAKTSSIYNPIIYTLNNKQCRDYIKQTLFGSKKTIVQSNANNNNNNAQSTNSKHECNNS